MTDPDVGGAPPPPPADARSSGAASATTPPPADPPWRPARARRRRDAGGVFFGLVILAVGLYFFLTETLEIRLPDMGQLWPLFVIALGAWILIASMRPET